MPLAYPEQLAHKRRALAGALGRHLELARLEAPELTPADPTTAYRRRLKWLVGPSGELGMLARGEEHQVVDTPDCLVATPLLRRVAAALRARIQAGSFGALPLSAVDLREVQSPEGPRVLVALVVRAAAPGARATLAPLGPSLAAEIPEVAGLALEHLPERGPQHFGGRIEAVWGAEQLDEPQGSYATIATPGAFAQAHAGQGARLAAWIAERGARLARAPSVLELYAGSGALGLSLAATGARVHFVEAHRPSLERAVRAGERAGFEVRGAAEDAERFAVRAAAAGERFDLVIVDPPRRGLSPALRVALAELCPQRLAYVSCQPETLARDLSHLARLGLGVVELGALDMIPQTEEVESVALLEPTSPAPLPVAHLDARFVVFDVGPFTSGARQLDEARRVAGFDEAALVHPLPASASGLALVARDAQTARELGAALELEALVMSKRVPRAQGHVRRPAGAQRAARTSYRRLAVASGHALCRVRSLPASLGVTFAHLASIGHPVLGDASTCDAPTCKHFVERHGLDRAFAHVTRLTLPEGVELRSELAGDLRAVAESLGLVPERLGALATV